MSIVIKTLQDIHPEQIYVTANQYKVIKNKKPNSAFEIKDEAIAQQLIILSLVKKETKKIHQNNKNEKDNWLPDFEETGKYLLTPEGEYYIDYKKQQHKNNFWGDFRAWLTLAFAFIGCVLSIYSIFVNPK